MKNEMYLQTCVNCVMDTTDTDIVFDDRGICNYCNAYDARKLATVNTEKNALLELVDKIKQSGKGKDYDCVLGLSGGVDSSYLAYLAKEHGLRPLVVHVDTGWNSELAVNNIENIVKHLGFDLYTHVVDWEEMKDLQLAFFKAGVANADIPQDHVFPAILYKLASKYKIKYILSGGNFATESILPRSWGYISKDLVHIKDIHKKFGTKKLSKYPKLSLKKEFYYCFVKRIKSVRLLNYINYDKVTAKKLIQDKLGWRDYGGKHYESIFTRFFQGYYLVNRFGIDKRKAHLTSLILNKELTKAQAVEELNNPALDPKIAKQDKDFLAKKMGIKVDEFEDIINSPPRSYSEYKNIRKYLDLLIKIKRLVS